MVKPSQLPFYEEPPKVKYVYEPEEPGLLEKNIKIAREGLGSVASQVKSQLSEVQETASHIYETGKAHSQGAYNQLLDEDNVAARVGLIAGAGSLGLLVGVLRGRMMKRLLYTGVGLGTGTAVCYPEPAAEIGGKVYSEGRRTAMIAYNFVTGVPNQGGNNDNGSNLVAASMTRICYFLARKFKELYALAATKVGSITTGSSLTVTPIPSPTQPPTANVVLDAAPPTLEIQQEVEIPLEKIIPPTSPVIPDVSSETEEISKGEPPSEVVLEPPAKVVFVDSTEPSDITVDGDVGQSNPEDQDMYTTRGS